MVAQFARNFNRNFICGGYFSVLGHKQPDILHEPSIV